MIRFGWRCIAVLLVVIAQPVALRAADAPAKIDLFEAKIRPVLIRECYSCHSAGAKAIKGGLRLDSRAGVRAGGESGPVLVPGKPEESPLMEALRYEGLEMPPKGKLPDAVIADFERWIALGAPRPAGHGGGPGTPGGDRHRRRPAILGLSASAHAPAARRVAMPPGRPTTIDRFILAGLEARGLHPAADADRSHARPPALLRPARPAAVARGGRRIRHRPGAGRL